METADAQLVDEILTTEAINQKVFDDFVVAGPSSAYYNTELDRNEIEDDDEHAVPQITSNNQGGNGGIFVCGLCCKGFKTKQDLDNHFYVIHDRITPVACTCSKLTEATLLDHRDNCASGQESLYGSTSARTRGTALPDNFFARSPNVALRRLEQIDEKPYPCNNLEKNLQHICDACGQNLQTNDGLRIHMLSHYGGRNQTSQCKKVFETRSQLIRHMRTHTGEKPYSCDECQKRFRIKGRLTIHKLRHATNAYPCEICEIKFAGKADLTRHILTHTGEKPHVCDECAREFISKAKLVVHIRFHLRERPFVCEECARKFITKAKLTIHIRFHTGEKPYACRKCEKAFKTKAGVTQHRRTRIGCKPFRCGDCGKRSRTKLAITRHTRIHRGIE